MPQPIIVGDRSGLGAGITAAGGALSAALGRKAETQKELMKKNALQKALEEADFSTQQGQTTFLMRALQSGNDPKEAIEIMKQFKPSSLQKLLEQYQNPQMGMNTPNPDVSGNPNVIEAAPTPRSIDPATRNLPYSNIPQEVKMQMVADKDPEVSNFGKALLEEEDRARKIYNENRKYNTEQAKDHMKRVQENEPKNRIKRGMVNAIKRGIQERDLSQFSQDWWAKFLGDLGEGLVTPEGALVGTAVKEFFLSDLARVSGRPNQFIESRLLQVLPDIGKTEEANLSMASIIDYILDMEDKEIALTNQIAEQYEKDPNYGYVPGNISRIVSEQMKPYEEKARDKMNYTVRMQQEKEAAKKSKGLLSGLFSSNKKVPIEQTKGFQDLANKKPPPGTPLTIEMMTYFVDKYGKEKAIKNAKRLGYSIPDAEEAQRLAKEYSFQKGESVEEILMERD